MIQIETITIITTLIGPLGVFFYCFCFEEVNLFSEFKVRHYTAAAAAAVCAIMGVYLVDKTGTARGYGTLSAIPSMLGSAFLVDRYIADLNSPVSFAVYFWIGTAVAFCTLSYGVILIF